MSKVYYKGGYKYQLQENLVIKTGIYPTRRIETDYIIFDIDGTLTLKKGYAWDGATGFPDFKWIIQGSAAHDAGYQLLRQGLLPARYKEDFDILLLKLCREDGPKILEPVYLAVYQAVKVFGGRSSCTTRRRLILVAP